MASGSAVTNVGSGNQFNRVPFLKDVDMDGFKGCCGGWLKFSYVISAPLHMKGFWQFWGNDKVHWSNRLAASIDLIVHLALWFVALGLEIWCCLEKNRGHEMLQELQTSSLWALIVAVGGIAVAQLFAMWAGGQDAGKLFPTTYGVIVGGAYASIAFTMLWAILQPSVFPQMNAQYLHDPTISEELKVQRQCMLWAMMLKFLAVVTLKQNAAFWGPCTTDSGKEAIEQNAQKMEEMGVTPTGALASKIGV